MILFIILMLILIILAVATVVGLSIFGAGAIIIFADVIVCGVIIALIAKRIINR